MRTAAPLIHRVAGGAALVAALAACTHRAPQGPPAPVTAQDSVRSEAWGQVPDPVGFLLENRDSLDLSSSQLDQLRAINLDLFRHNARLQLVIDSLVPPPPPDYAYGRRVPELTPEQRQRLHQLVAVRGDNIRRAREDADSVLTEAQRAKADTLRQRVLRQRRR